MRATKGFVIFFLLLIGNLSAEVTNPIIFVVQPPFINDFAAVNSTFGNHRGDLEAAPRGGDLYIRYTDGSLKNLTRAAGYGNDGFQGTNSILVRDPEVHWSGEKIIFSMLIGSPTEQYQYTDWYWQLYEMTGLQKNETPQIAKVSNQPENFNNVMPAYTSDNSIIFISDRPRNGALHLYPQRDEYESTDSNSGLWKLNPQSGKLEILDHAPSGDFDPFIDSFGRIIFTRWDHLQRDQQNLPDYAPTNMSSEAEDAVDLGTADEIFPEPRTNEDPDSQPNLNHHDFNHFFPWMLSQDGTGLETLNHIGRQELHDYISSSFNDDPNIEEYYGQYSRFNPNPILNFLHIHEDPATAGRYIGINAPEFRTHSAGQIVGMTLPPGQASDKIAIEYLTHPDTASHTDNPTPNHSGLYRDALFSAGGSLIAAHTTNTQEESNLGTRENPQSRYSFRIKTLKKVGGYYVPDQNLTSGISRSITYYDPDVLVTYNTVTMWELQPVELKSRTIPPAITEILPHIEQAVFDSAGVNLSDFKAFLANNNLALIVSRDLTVRDGLDIQQPFNLRVAGTDTEAIPLPGKVYNISSLQFFIGEQIRRYMAYDYLSYGRRVIAQNLSNLPSYNLPNPEGPVGSVRIGSDGSMAAFVPARRALSWQTTNPSGNPIVRERYWLTFQPGEVRVCTSCHGVNSKSQIDTAEPQNTPQALADLLEYWKTQPHDIPSFGLKLKKLTTDNLAKNEVLSGNKIRLNVIGKNSVAANQNLTLSASAGKVLCGDLGEINTDSAGRYSKTFKVPRVSRKIKVTFNLTQNSQIRASSFKYFTPGESGELKARALCNRLKKIW